MLHHAHKLIRYHELFKFDCGYKVETTFSYNNGNISKMEVTRGEFDRFLHKWYDYLYKDIDDIHDSLIFVFSGHGSGDEFGYDKIIFSDYDFQFNTKDFM